MKFWKKKEKNPYPRSFAKRLAWRIMMTLLVAMTITSLLVYTTAYLTILTGTELIIPQILENKIEQLEGKLSEVTVAAVNTIPDIEANIDHPDKMHELMERIVRLNPHVRSCGISFIDNYYPQKGHWFCPYAVRGDSTDIQRKTLGNKSNDYLSAEWFTNTLAIDSCHWSKPFFSSSDSVKIPLVAYLAPIRDKQGKTVAVLGIDFLLDELNNKGYSRKSRSDHSSSKVDNSANQQQDTTTTWSAERSVYSFAIDSTGTYLMHPDIRRVINDNFLTRVKETPATNDDEFAHKMVSDDVGEYFLENDDLLIDGETVHVFYSTIKGTDWKFAIVFPSYSTKLITYFFGGFLLFFILIGVLVVFFAGRRSIKKRTKPLKQLVASANEVAKGNFHTPLPVIKTRDEIQLLRDSFENMQQSLTKYTEELRTTTAQNASMESELKVAHDIQMSMLPKTFPPYPERHDIDIYGSLVPAKGVGGDLFDFFIRDEKLFFCIGDVSGKGVPASLFMAVTRSLFRNISAHTAVPSEIVRTLNNAVTDGNDTNMFVTVFVGVLDLATGLLRYCNAGHDAPLLVGRDVGALSCQPNLPIGVMMDFNYTQQEVSIDPQTTIFLFTDGLNEAENSQHGQFGDMRIWGIARRLLEEHSHQPQHLIEEMTAAVHSFVGDAEQSDDLTMLAIQYKGGKK